LLKHRPDWAVEPKFWKESEDKELMARREGEMARIGKIVEREMKRKAKADKKTKK
jgi:hypothetical protein